jgi:uncharacterized protein (DUF1015 family)
VPPLRAVPRFTPFRGIRYAVDDLHAVTSPPYDVITPAERKALAARHPANVVHIDSPAEAEGPERYEHAAALFERWLDDGTLITDPEPALYLYRLSFHDETGTPHVMAGVLGGLEVEDPGPGADVLPHEQTTPKATTDRLELTRSTGTNLSPVWGLSLAKDLHALFVEPATLLGAFSDEGVTHQLERIDDPGRVAAISDAIASQPVVIADGHHRYGVARTFRDEQRAARSNRPGPYDETLTFVAELVDHQLHVQAIHRLLSDVKEDLRAPLASSFELVPAGLVSTATLSEMEAKGALCLVERDGSGTYLVPKPGAFDGVRDLDSVRLEHALGDLPRTTAYQHGVDATLDALRRGDANYAVLLRPVSVQAIEATAHDHVLMPPKSTFFWPKLKTGLVFRRAI